MTSEATFLKVHKDILTGLVIALVLISTFVIIYLPIPFSTNGISVIWAGDIILIICLLYLFFKKWLLKGELAKHSLMAKLLLTGLLLISVFFAVSLAARLALHQSLAGNFLVTRVLVLSTMTLFYLDAKIVSLKSMSIGLLGYATCVNLCQIYTVTVGDVVPRHSKVLGNVNVYDTAMLLLLIILMYVFAKGYLKGPAVNLLLWFNAVAALFLLLLSGSRVAFIVYLILGAALWFIYFRKRFSWRGLLCFLIAAALSAAGFVGIFQHNLFRSNDHIRRSLYYPMKILGDINLGEKPPVQDDDDDDIILDNVDTSVKGSNVLRSIIQEEAVRVIKSNFLFGTGRPDVNIKQWNFQAAHNFILEFLLTYGIFGFFICIFVIFMPLFFLLFRLRISLTAKLTACCLYFAILLISVVQPILSTKLTILVLFWAAIGILSLENSGTEKQ